MVRKMSFLGGCGAADEKDEVGFQVEMIDDD